LRLSASKKKEKEGDLLIFSEEKRNKTGLDPKEKKKSKKQRERERENSFKKIIIYIYLELAVGSFFDGQCEFLEDQTA
jgi:hypothetical protein